MGIHEKRSLFKVAGLVNRGKILIPGTERNTAPENLVDAKTGYTPERIVSLQPSITSTLAGLGLLDRVVACTKHCAAVVPELEVASSFIIDDSWTADATQIIAAKADMVMASVPYGPEAIAQILKAGVRVLALSPRTLNDIFGDIATIAALMDVTERGRHVVEAMQQEIASVRKRIAACPCPRVYCEEWGKPMLTSQPWVAELVQAAGGKFVGEPASATSADTICALDPEVIVFAWCGAGDRVPAERLVQERQWHNISAVRNGRVHVIADYFLTTPAPVLTVGLRALAHAIHPEAFEQAPELGGASVMRTSGEPHSSKPY